MRKLITSRGPWATLDTGVAGPRDGEALKDAGEARNLGVLVEDGVIVEVASRDELLDRHADLPHEDLGDLLVTPGFVDPHTHPVFAATREDEFEMRVLGKSYEEIAKAGGGIRNSARRLRGKTQEELEVGLEERLDLFLLHGTTTIEAKSGYGLSTESERASLRAIKAVDARHPLDLVPTFLGAHEIPDEYRDDREAYIRLVCDEMLPAVAKEGLATACDVFCEAHVFSVEESRRILARAKELGLDVKLHADEIEPLGGAELGADLRALSADHLVAISDEGMDRMRDAGTIPILLPGTSTYLGLPKDAPGKEMLARGMAPALATDFNPGSCPSRSMPLMMGLAAIKYGMTGSQVLGAATWNAACALDMEGQVGVIRPGARADLTALALPDLRRIPYHLGENHVHTVVKRGEIVVRGGTVVPR